jgi:two-component system, NtrC family, response regulator AtoC
VHRVKRALLTWSDAGTDGPAPAHQAPRPSGDRGPILRLLDQDESRYDALWILTVPAGEKPAEKLAGVARVKVPHVEVRALEIDDPSDYAKLFRVVGPVAAAARRAFAREAWAIDVLLSAGTPQSQTLWVVLVQAGVLPARMLQVIPAVFVGKTHPRAVREVRLDIDGFPEIRALRAEVARLRAEVRAPSLVGESEPMRALGARIARVAATDVPTLVLGETGTGKELVARAIHDSSARAEGPFVAENCGVFAEGVVQSELFGHEAGSFTGAAGRRRGVFEQAHQGTLLLDEVGELSPRVQSQLLRVLQEGVLRRVGGEARVAVDVRVIAATHRDLEAMVAEGTFREDLYYRLRGATLPVPPLRERAGDLELLVRAFLDEVRTRRGGKGLEVSREALRALSSHAWPGNVRELRAEVMRWGVFCDERVDVADLAPEIVAPATQRPSPPIAAGVTGEVPTLAAAVEAAERAAITAALASEKGNLSRTARALGIDRNTLKRKLLTYDLPTRADFDSGARVGAS